MESNIENDCSTLENLFQHIISDMKSSFPIWEDFLSRASKLHVSLRTTIVASSAFLEVFQKIADAALSTRGGAAGELGASLTRLCLRQRGIEEKLKSFASAISDSLVVPIQERLEEWKKVAVQLDKDHAKESKKIHQDIKKAFTETVRLKKKAKKAKPEVVKQLDQAILEYGDKYQSLESLERNFVRTAMLADRSHFCHFVACLKPVMDSELAMFSEMTHIQEIMDGLNAQALETSLPTSSESVGVQDAKKPDAASNGSPVGSKGSRKSSLSSASSTYMSSPSHQPCNMTQNSLTSSGDYQDGVMNFSSSEQNNRQLQHSWMSWPENQPIGDVVWTDQPNTAPPQLFPPPYPVTDIQPTAESQKINPYAVPCYVNPEKAAENQGYAKLCMCQKGQPGSPTPGEETKRNPAFPPEGYVNMNQLACLAAHQHGMDMKKNEDKKISAPDNGVLDTSNGNVQAIAAQWMQRAKSNRSKTAEDVVLPNSAAGELGASLTRLCLRQRGIEEKLKSFASAISDSLVVPIQERLEEWKKVAVQLDKDHAKESKKIHQDMKKAFTETVRLKKKAKKAKPEVVKQLDQAILEYGDKYQSLESLERNFVRTAMLADRSHFCHFVACLKPVMDSELAMFSEMTHIQEIMDGLNAQALETSLPTSSENVGVQDVKKPDAASNGSPVGSKGSRKSSLSSASSTYMSSPSHQPCNMTQNSLTSSGDYQDGVMNFSSSEQNNRQLQHSWMSWPENQPIGDVVWTDQPNTAPPQLFPPPYPVTDIQPTAKSQKINPYAVPCYVNPEKAAENQGYAKLCMCQKGQPGSPTPGEETKRNPAFPPEGYVNMNQLACLAAHQHGMDMKKNEDKKILTPDNGVLDTSNGNVQAIAAQWMQRAKSNRSKTAEDVVLPNSMCNSGATLSRRNNPRDRSLPPISRKSRVRVQFVHPDSSPPTSKSSSVSKSSSLSFPPQHCIRMNENLPPLPPPELLQHPCSENIRGDDDGDNLPLPPLPDELMAASCYPESSLAGSLNARFTQRQFSLSNGGKPAELIRRSSDAMLLDHESVSEESFSQTIQRGVTLKRVPTSDRSAPRLPAN